MLYQQLLKEQEYLNHQIAHLKSNLATKPPGNFFYTQHNGYVKWYQTNGRNPIYISKKDPALAQSLISKNYLSHQLEDLYYERDGINQHLSHIENHPKNAEHFLADPIHKELLFHTFKPLSCNHSEWMHAPYEKNPRYPEQLIIETASGISVRSKSEALIATILTAHNIPFRYECALHFDTLTIYPDFTILHPMTNQILYYEHFGMMDKPHYRLKTATKLKTYLDHGIIPSIHLITTYETKEHPLSARKVERIIKEYFL